MDITNRLADGEAVKLNDNPLCIVRRDGNMIRTLILDRGPDGAASIIVNSQHGEHGPDGPYAFSETFAGLTPELLTALADAATRLATER